MTSVTDAGILVRKATPCSLLLGQAGGAGGGAGGALHVGGVRVFRAPVLAAPAALHLAAHGPDLPCQVLRSYLPAIFILNAKY